MMEWHGPGIELERGHLHPVAIWGLLITL
jgi:hypothetical protein